MSKIVVRSQPGTVDAPREKTPFPKDIGLRPKTEIVPEDEAYKRAIERRRLSPLEAMQEIQIPKPPLAKGALVELDKLRNFLEALAGVTSTAPSYPALESVKLSYQPSSRPLLYIEGGGTRVWAILALEVEARSGMGFEALVSVKRAVNVLAAVSRLETKVMVGIDEGGVCLGSHAIPFRARVEDFAVAPLMPEPLSRAVIPSFYWQEIVDRVIPACPESVMPGSRVESSVLLEFETEVIGEEVQPVAVAVASDGPRMHILRLPRIAVDENSERLPPASHLPRGFVTFLAQVAAGEWVGLEVAERATTAKGNDFIVTSNSHLEKRANPSPTGRWRKFCTMNPPAFSLSRKELLQALRECPGPDFTMSMDSMTREAHIESESEDGTRFSRTFGGDAGGRTVYGTVTMQTDHALQSASCCRGELVRIAVDPKPGYGPSAVIFRGDDDLFRAVIMSMGRGDL